MIPVVIENGRAVATFGPGFPLEDYPVFLAAKKLPEVDVKYDPWADTYRVSTAARFAKQLSGGAVEANIEIPELSAHLFDYQAYIGKLAITVKRFACFADCGLGKTMLIHEFAGHVVRATGCKALIFSPLQVIEQTRAEALRYGYAEPHRLNTREELIAWLAEPGEGIGIVNYEKMIPGQIDELRNLGGVILDESSILKGGGGTIKWNLIHSCKGIEYKLSCTATPAPNDIMEYASQAGFLEKLKSENDILWTYFTRDKEGEWRIKPYAREGFYRFLSSWSIYLRDPAAYGFKDNPVSAIPPPEFFEHPIPATAEQMAIAEQVWHESGAGLFGEERMGIVQRIKLSQVGKGFLYPAKGDKSPPKRIPSNKPKVIELLVRKEVAAGRQTLVWTIFDEEAAILAEQFPDFGGRLAVLDGTTKPAERQAILERFRTGETQVLIAKASMLGFGMNMQHCRAMVFSGLNDSYEQFYQAVRRAYRYGQTERLRVHIPFVAEVEGQVLANVLRKKEGFEKDAAEQEAYYRNALGGLE